ncbi:MAG TPA: TIGR03668 family PPOX class F420-dependent oxidoreductase [Acidimicrobiia bacterium]|nr:TIGR03668 family PPOX class F420-dependent oxidoreductase [Acidimicrobiia bacterium]
MERAEALERVESARVARLATVTPEGRPHIVPVTFALDGNHLVTMVDHKPKTTHRLQRLVNVEVEPRVALLVDHYQDDWELLWWVRVDGTASVHLGDDPWSRAQQVLVAKYPQYQTEPPQGPALMIEITGVSAWASTP